MSTMNLSFFKKILIIFFLIFFLNQDFAFAWNGYDYDNKADVEIGPGNLVREGLVIQFYDAKDDNYHTAKVLFMDSVAGGTRIQLNDLDAKKERTLIMQ
jgi:hypothetical protein